MRTLLLALGVWLAGALPAGAQDACLTGASLLPDQRALAARRSATETACPCAGSGTRRDYQTCARRVLKSALAAGDLRGACKRVAAGVNKGAVCGSSRVACGRFRAAARTPLTCRARRPEQCADNRRFQMKPCADETHCADVVDWTASTCVDVRERGPYAAGVRVLSLTKPSVTTYCTGGSGDCSTMPFGAGCRCAAASECESGVCESQPRTLATSVWYPAPPGSEPINPGSGAVDDAPLDASGGPYPLLLFSHGSCGYPNQSTFLTPVLASHGFIVAAPPHPGNTLFEFPSCGTPSALTVAAVERPQDVLFVLDEMLAAALDPGSPFFGAIDADRVGMSGHSFGGFTTYLAVGLDARFKVALPMAAAVPGSPVLDVPSLTMLGQIDSVVNNTAIRTAYTNALAPKYLVEIQNAGHYAFSNFCFPGPDCSPPATLTQAESHAAVLRYTLPFLKVHLAGDPTFAPFLALPPPPGFVVQAEP